MGPRHNGQELLYVNQRHARGFCAVINFARRHFTSAFYRRDSPIIVYDCTLGLKTDRFRKYP